MRGRIREAALDALKNATTPLTSQEVYALATGCLLEYASGPCGRGHILQLRKRGHAIEKWGRGYVLDGVAVSPRPLAEPEPMLSLGETASVLFPALDAAYWARDVARMRRIIREVSA